MINVDFVVSYPWSRLYKSTAQKELAAGKGNPAISGELITKTGSALNRSRRIKYNADKESATQLQGVSIPTIPAVVIYFYRQRKNDQLHAIRCDLWVGQQKKASYPTVHTLGWTEKQVKDYIRQAVSSFSREHGVQISGIAATVELDPSTCPLLNCPLKPSNDAQMIANSSCKQ